MWHIHNTLKWTIWTSCWILTHWIEFILTQPCSAKYEYTNVGWRNLQSPNSPAISNALCSKGWHLKKKSYHEMFNFENWFLCQFSSNTRFSFGGGSLNTPKIGKRKKEFTNINLRGFKTQKTWRGCFSRIKRVSKFSFLYMLWYLLS